MTLSSFTSYVRVFQVMLSVISIGLNSKSISNAGSISAVSESINEAISQDSITSTAVSTSITFNKSPQILSIVTSSLTTLSHGFYSGIAPSLLTFGQIGLISTPRLINGFSSSFNSMGELFYATGLSTSEISQLSLWFSSLIYQTSSYGSWDCSSYGSLLNQYNLTNEEDLIALNDFNGVNVTELLTSENYDTNNTEINEFLSLLTNLTIDSTSNEKLSIVQFNESNFNLQNELIISLSQDCSLKKSSIAINLIGSLLFFVSTGTVASSFIQLYMTSNLIAKEGNNKNITHQGKDNERNGDSNDSSLTYSIISTFAHLKPSNQLSSSSSSNEKITANNTNNKVIELKTELSNNFTLTTITELELLENSIENNQEILEKSNTIEQNLFSLRFTRAILFPTLESKD